MRNFITPNETLGTTDSESILLAIKKAKETGQNRVVIPEINDRTGKNVWIIDSTILLPDDIEIILDNAHLRMADGTFCNMFRNVNAGTDIGRTLAGEQKNIHIRGIGKATLDGGEYNGLSEHNSLQDGNPHVSVNTLMLLVNIDGMTVENIKIVNQRWWSITNIYVRNGLYRNINFKADLSRIDENGIRYCHEYPKKYPEIYTKNADGIDLRIGCNNFVIENITGFTEDDSVALTALGKFETQLGYTVEGKDSDIHDVKIRHIATDPYICSCVRLLNDNGHKLYNIDVDGVTHLQKSAPLGWDKTIHCVRIGDMLYADSHSELGDTHHITVRNVSSHAEYAVSVCKGLTDSLIENITVLQNGTYGFGGVDDGESVLKNCTVRNISTPGENAVAVNYSNFKAVDCDIDDGSI